MVDEIRKLDPTRLVEDNSPCNYDHVEDTDLNSWHFYIDDHAEAAAAHRGRRRQTEPGSAFNYCPGQKQSTAPLINSEYGGVSAGGGDRDISWGFRDLTTLLRRQPKIQGYVYTELTDIEWEHNGFVNYDRTPKDFGYDAFVPDMTAERAAGGRLHRLRRARRRSWASRARRSRSRSSSATSPTGRAQPKLRWWVSGYDDQGDVVRRRRPADACPSPGRRTA